MSINTALGNNILILVIFFLLFFSVDWGRDLKFSKVFDEPHSGALLQVLFVPSSAISTHEDSYRA